MSLIIQKKKDKIKFNAIIERKEKFNCFTQYKDIELLNTFSFNNSIKHNTNYTKTIYAENKNLHVISRDLEGDKTKIIGFDTCISIFEIADNIGIIGFVNGKIHIINLDDERLIKELVMFESPIIYLKVDVGYKNIMAKSQDSDMLILIDTLNYRQKRTYRIAFNQEVLDKKRQITGKMYSCLLDGKKRELYENHLNDVFDSLGLSLNTLDYFDYNPHSGYLLIKRHEIQQQQAGWPDRDDDRNGKFNTFLHIYDTNNNNPGTIFRYRFLITLKLSDIFLHNYGKSIMYVDNRVAYDLNTIDTLKHPKTPLMQIDGVYSKIHNVNDDYFIFEDKSSYKVLMTQKGYKTKTVELLKSYGCKHYAKKSNIVEEELFTSIFKSYTNNILHDVNLNDIICEFI